MLQQYTLYLNAKNKKKFKLKKNTYLLQLE